MAKNPKKILDHILKVRNNLNTHTHTHISKEKLLYEFYNQIVKLQMTLDYILKNIKNPFLIKFYYYLLL